MMRFRVDCRQRMLGIEARDAHGTDDRLLGSRVSSEAEVEMAPAVGLASLTAVIARACRPANAR